jgi:hypothetical protein
MIAFPRSIVCGFELSHLKQLLLLLLSEWGLWFDSAAEDVVASNLVWLYFYPVVFCLLVVRSWFWSSGVSVSVTVLVCRQSTVICWLLSVGCCCLSVIVVGSWLSGMSVIGWWLLTVDCRMLLSGGNCWWFLVVWRVGCRVMVLDCWLAGAAVCR